jgi:hypothetical protein
MDQVGALWLERPEYGQVYGNHGSYCCCLEGGSLGLPVC